MSDTPHIALVTENCVACHRRIDEGTPRYQSGHVRVEVVPSGRTGPVPIAVLAQFCSEECCKSLEATTWGCYRDWKPEDGMKLLLPGEDE